MLAVSGKYEMKILYLISISTNGIGGHYYSLKSTVEAMKDNIECCIVSIGKTESPVLKTIDLHHQSIIFPSASPLNIIRILFKLLKIVKLEQPDILHAFDGNALFYTKIISHYYKIPYIATLCGGPNPDPVIYPQFGKYFYPKAKNLILYSTENLEYFKNNAKYKSSNLYLIPNRIAPPPQDYILINDIRQKLFPEATIFLRISRFAKSHKDSIIQSITLIKALNNENMNVQLIIIGTIQENEVYEDILKLIDKNIILLTDNKYTVNASKMIDIADVVIGTGRGFMEGASMKKIMLCPSGYTDYPIIVSQENIFNIFSTNFSFRSSEISQKNNCNSLKQILENRKLRNELSEYMGSYSKQYFEIESVKGRIIRIYQNLKYDSALDLFDTLIHFVHILYLNSPQLQQIGIYLKGRSRGTDS